MLKPPHTRCRGVVRATDKARQNTGITFEFHSACPIYDPVTILRHSALMHLNWASFEYKADPADRRCGTMPVSSATP